ncbi:MAG: type II toxin-antitoxin system mRNA interferase toxin, RelE/StbE family [Candidatus Electrothrix sp. GW3-4]|uniref:type II toxin-antitoxin system RelE family toxin n=1 Tax=Candidatus Electrothrix sp. GW3-4 TaxID=3126740 RepID=UPI0030D30686
MFEFRIAESNKFEKRKKKIDPSLYAKIKNIVYPQLRKNPYFGANIKKLKGDLSGYYRFRIGNYRLFYLIEEEKVIVVVVDLQQRQNAYK